MLTVRSIVLRNFLRFRGEQRVELSPLVYGVVSALEGDAERSNGNGKTSLVEALTFALYGQHRWATEDDWISTGEKEGGVWLTLSNGIEVARTRKRGGATRLTLTKLTGETWEPTDEVATGAAAQERIERELTGLSWTDFAHTSFFEQKRMARFVVARPADRTAIVASWFDLDPVRAAHELARKELAAATEELRAVEQRATFREMSRREALRGYGFVRPEPHVGEPSRAVDAAYGDPCWAEIVVFCERRAEEARGEALEAEQGATRLRSRLDARRERALLERDAVEHERRKEELAELERTFAPSPDAEELRAAGRKASDAGAEWKNAVAKRDDAARVALGLFDGRCPVAGIDCPAKDRINADREPARVRHAEACEREEKARKAVAAANESYAALSRKGREADERAAKIRVVRGLVERTKGAAEQLRREAAPEGTEAELDAAFRTAIAEESRARDAARRWDDEAAKAKRNAVADEEDRLAEEAARRKVARAREAAAVLGPAGAQRRVAERELAEVEAGANELLADCGIDLSVRATWGRETKGLASECSSCGAPFPASAKAKVCERCGAERGFKLDERLDVELSRRSGGLEDVAGIALELSAAAWLRDRRGSGWGLALVDEPFSSLDRANRRALARGFLRLLRARYGFGQALVVSHADDVDDYPGRIEVVAKGDRSEILVR